MTPTEEEYRTALNVVRAYLKDKQNICIVISSPDIPKELPELSYDKMYVIQDLPEMYNKQDEKEPLIKDQQDILRPPKKSQGKGKKPNYQQKHWRKKL